MKRIAGFLLTLAVVAGCATTGTLFGPSPEAQIKTGANGINASATLGNVLLKNNKITPPQGKSYSAILRTALGHLDVAFDRLADCRKRTGSNEKTQPDPCAATVADDIALGINIANDVKKTLDAK